jgi:hypothetical protein
MSAGSDVIDFATGVVGAGWIGHGWLKCKI